jgi:peptide/nickel transport system permease protein
LILVRVPGRSRMKTHSLLREGRPGQNWLAHLVVGLSILLAIIGPSIAPYDPEKPTPSVLLPPSFAHPFGTDASGLDVLSVILAGFRVDVFIALLAVGISLAGGIVLGALCGYGFNNNRVVAWISGILVRVLDMVQSIPVFILALALVGMFGQNIRNVIIAVAFVNLPIFARLTRTAVRRTESREFVLASRALGVREPLILGAHVLPNSLEGTIAYASIAVGGAILLTAGLSFLGAGVRPPTPEWGAEIASGAGYVITGQWWISVAPGLVLSTVVLGFAILGDSVRSFLEKSERFPEGKDGVGYGALPVSTGEVSWPQGS